MISHVSVVLAEGVPPGTPLAVLTVPIGIAVFIGSIYLLVRSNIGTRRGYLVSASALFGFLVIMGLFWTFGAPGTPQATGPANLPGQPQGAYNPIWVPFAETSALAQRPEYADLVDGYPETFGEVPGEFIQEDTEEGADDGDEPAGADVEDGAGDIQSFFADPEHGEVVGEQDEIVDIEFAEAPNGFPVIAVTFQPVDEETLDVLEDEEPVTLFAFFDAGNPLFPGLVLTGIAAALFLLHAVLLYWDENEERRELEQAVAAEGEPEPAREPVEA